jgi:chorismate dehydratase
MLEKEMIPGVHIVSGYPSRLNKMLGKGELDISPVSAAAYADIEKHVVLIPDFCIGSIGYVHSVILISRLPIEELNGKKIGLTSASQTSVILLKSLLKKYYNIEPEYTETNPNPSLKDMDAALVIGNEAMTADSNTIPYIYDLGDLWFRKTGYPVVFAVFAVRKRVLKEYPEKIKSIIKSYHASLLCLETEESTVIQKAGEKYPEISCDLFNYYKNLEYRFTEKLKEALGFYFSITEELGFLGKVEKLDFLPGNFSL